MPGQVPSTSGESLGSAEAGEGAGSGAAESPPPSLEVLRARYGAAKPLLRFHGQVSYYADSLSGNPTASGEPYQPRALTAAHRSLPFGTVVRVVREDTRQLVFVRINDRGPFVRGRVLDLSRAAAETIGLIGRGVTRVTAEVVEYGPKPKARKKYRKKRR
jgi:rare lipoprotein A